MYYFMIVYNTESRLEHDQHSEETSGELHEDGAGTPTGRAAVEEQNCHARATTAGPRR